MPLIPHMKVSSPAASAAVGTAPDRRAGQLDGGTSGHGKRPGAAVPQVSPSRHPSQERGGEPGAPARLPARPIPLLTLWRLALTDNAFEAHDIERLARDEGATPFEISEAWKARRQRMDDEVVVIYGAWS